MIYFFHGDDLKKRREAVSLLLLGEVTKMNDLDFEQNKIEEFIKLGNDLFGQKNILILENVLEKKENLDFFLGKIEVMKEAQTVFIFLERNLENLNKKAITLFEKNSIEFKGFLLPQNEKNIFNIFTIADFFGQRDKKNLWLNLQKGIVSGLSSEEIFNILNWQVKNMLLVKEEKNETEGIKNTNLKPFVYKKASNFAKNFTLEELKKISADFVDFYHQARRGEVDFETGLERLLFSCI